MFLASLSLHVRLMHAMSHSSSILGINMIVLRVSRLVIEALTCMLWLQWLLGTIQQMLMAPFRSNTTGTVVIRHTGNVHQAMLLLTHANEMVLIRAAHELLLSKWLAWTKHVLLALRGHDIEWSLRCAYELVRHCHSVGRRGHQLVLGLWSSKRLLYLLLLHHKR